jgi:hypothetical protein
MKPLLFGAVLGLLWLALGVPLTPALAVGSWRTITVLQPVTIAFVLGAAARPYVLRPRRWTV